MGRNWEYFLGNTVFCMGGRLQNTKARPVNIATGAFVILPCILFFIFSAHDLWHDVSPAVPLIFAYLAFICVSSFLHASTSDPGVSGFSVCQEYTKEADLGDRYYLAIFIKTRLLISTRTP